MPTNPMSKSSRNISRHSATSKIQEPITGARIGPKPEIVCTNASTVSRVLPEKQSLTIANEIAVALAAPTP